MSRAFVKELDDSSELELPEPSPDPHPNYITPLGYQALRERLQTLSAARASLLPRAEELGTKSEMIAIERELRRLQRRLERATVVDPPANVGDEIRFGATITMTDERGGKYEFTVVGEDEVCAKRGAISWLSPVAQAVLGKGVGDLIEWERPSGTLELEIISVCYTTA